MPDLVTITAIALGAYNVAHFATARYKAAKAKAAEYQDLIDGLKLVVAKNK